MKKFLLVAASVYFFSLTVNAQTQKDWFLIGGDISKINLDLQKGNTAFSFDINPRVAWFVKDNFALGAQALIGVSTATGYTSFSYGIGPIARYYFAGRAVPDLKKTRLFLDGNVGLFGTNTKVSGLPSTNTNGLGIGFGPGIAYFLNPNIALEVLAKYNLTVGFGNATTDNAISISVGFQIYLPRAKLKSLKNDVK